MANHQSAKKRSRQTIKKKMVNRIIMSKYKTISNQLLSHIDQKNVSSATNSFKLLNSALSKAVKKGTISQGHASRKLSSFSNQLKKIV